MVNKQFISPESEKATSNKVPHEQLRVEVNLIVIENESGASLNEFIGQAGEKDIYDKYWFGDSYQKKEMKINGVEWVEYIGENVVPTYFLATQKNNLVFILSSNPYYYDSSFPHPTLNQVLSNFRFIE